MRWVEGVGVACAGGRRPVSRRAVYPKGPCAAFGRWLDGRPGPTSCSLQPCAALGLQPRQASMQWQGLQVHCCCQAAPPAALAAAGAVGRVRSMAAVAAAGAVGSVRSLAALPQRHGNA